MRYLEQTARLVVDPPGAAARLLEGKQFWRSLAFALAASLLYQSALRGLLTDVVSIVRLGGFDEGGFAIVVDQLKSAAPLAAGLVIAVAVVLVPVCLMLIGTLKHASGAPETLRANYRGLASAALTSFGVSLGLWILPAGWLGQSNERSVAIWSALPFAVVAVLVTVAASHVAEAGLVRAAAASAVACWLVGLLPFMGRAFLFVVAGSAVGMITIALRTVLSDRATAAREKSRLDRLRSAVDTDPGDAASHAALGIHLVGSGSEDDAIRHLETAVELDPTDTRSHYQIGKLARRRGDLSRAIAAFDEVLRADSDYAGGEVWREVGATYLAARQYSDAKDALVRFVAEPSNSAEGHYLLGLAMEGMGDRSGARREMTRVIELSNGEQSRSAAEESWRAEAEDYLKGEVPLD